ncbi:MAG: hypothetical protein U0572_05310 [Phycisphaerales bacterium]
MDSAACSVVVTVVPWRLIGDDLAVWLEGPGDGPRRLPTSRLGERADERSTAAALVAALPFARDVVRCERFAAFTDPARVPNNREVALASWAVVRAVTARSTDVAAVGGSWYPDASLPPLADDHATIVATAKRAMAAEILHDPVTRRLLPRHLLRSSFDDFGPASETARRTPVLFGVLPDPFPLSAIRRFYERLLGTSIDRGNFRRKLVELRPTGIVKELPIFQRGVRHRAAQLFTFDPRAWERWATGED